MIGAMGPAEHSWSVPGSSTTVAPGMSAAELRMSSTGTELSPGRYMARVGTEIAGRTSRMSSAIWTSTIGRNEPGDQALRCNLAIHARWSGSPARLGWTSRTSFSAASMRAEMGCGPLEVGLPFLQVSPGQVGPHGVGRETPDAIRVRCRIEAGQLSRGIADPKRMGRVTPAASMTAPRSSTRTSTGGASPGAKRSDSPIPRRSSMTTRPSPARRWNHSTSWALSQSTSRFVMLPDMKTMS